MTEQLIEHLRKRREFADVTSIVTTIALVVSLVIAVTAVSIDIARADGDYLARPMARIIAP